MKQINIRAALPVIAGAVLLAVAYFAGLPLFDSPETLGVFGMAAAAAAPANSVRAALAKLPPFGRIIENLPAFEAVPTASGTGKAQTRIPKYALTALRITLELGGTSFLKSHITDARITNNSKTIWQATGSDLDKMNKYKKCGNNAAYLTMDLTDPHMKTYDAEMIGGLDMSKVKGEVRLEVTISGSTAPTLAGKVVWGPPQGNELMQKLLQYSYPLSVVGKNSVPLNFKGATIKRLHFMYSGTDWGSTASSAAFSGNTGNGTMGTVTVAAGTKVGQWQLTVTEPAVNAGTLQLIDPDGNLVAVKGAVGSAFTGGGLTFTLADGGTDFVAGDGFTITVAENVNGNITQVEIKKDGRSVWDMECKQARFRAKEYGYEPQSKCYTVDFVADGHPEGMLVTQGASQLDINVWVSAADSVVVYAEVLDDPDNN